MDIYFGGTSHLPRIMTRNIYIGTCFCMNKNLIANFSHMNKIIESRVLCSFLFSVTENNRYLLVPGKRERGKKRIFLIKIRTMVENCFRTFGYSHT